MPIPPRFRILLCNAGLENQNQTSSSSSSSSSSKAHLDVVTRFAHRGVDVYPKRANRGAGRLRLEASIQAVNEEKQQKHVAFVKKSESQARLLQATRKDQAAAVTMLVEESWRYQQCVKRQRPKRAETTSGFGSRSTTTSALPRKPLTAKQKDSCLNPEIMKHLLNDVQVLMHSPVWRTEPTEGAAGSIPPPPATIEKHPYLFTMNEIHQLSLFVYSSTATLEGVSAVAASVDES